MPNRHYRRTEAFFEKVKNARFKQAQKDLADFLRSNFPYHYVHSACGKVAFYIQQKPTLGQLISPEWCMFPNGDKPKADQEARCGSCGGELTHEDLDPELHLRRTI